MAIGMTYEQYWYGDPLMVRAFYKAEKLRQQRMDEQAWIAGAYVYRAIDATVGNMYRKRGQTQAEYPQRPLSAENTEQAKQEQAEQERKRLVAYLNSVMNTRKGQEVRK